MAEEKLDTKLAAELFSGFCARYKIELSDLVYIAERLKQADDLKNISTMVHQGGHRDDWANNLALAAVYKGPDPSWIFKCFATNEGRVSRSDTDAEKYFQDLGNRVGIQFQNARHYAIGGSTYKGFDDGTIEIAGKGLVQIYADALAPSGKALQVRIFQHYISEYERRAAKALTPG